MNTQLPQRRQYVKVFGTPIADRKLTYVGPFRLETAQWECANSHFALCPTADPTIPWHYLLTDPLFWGVDFLAVRWSSFETGHQSVAVEERSCFGRSNQRWCFHPHVMDKLPFTMDIGTICRICLANGASHHIFDTEDTKLAADINTFLRVKVSANHLLLFAGTLCCLLKRACCRRCLRWRYDTAGAYFPP